ncbi:hypothetical protein M2139_001455 [Enterococcus sp. PF1-24]|uniref:hypothetical protein n=1 Tax=unclassified Enterococcus TaxID=2608891 RepID=UPI0024759502|nr:MULTISPECIES: hypothetical protein [unclassified Enterococcus]MDH6364406.1 hypothetical protein [Enterococcus sp. PFB1-1]MDH6401571.1 hypothetical protein [Enterococcus sp. PF1-24]
MLTSKIGALLFALIALLTLLVTFGLPLGEFTLGGQYAVLPIKMRVMTGISFVIQLFAILIVLQAGGVMKMWFPIKIVKGIGIFFSVYLTINVVMNFMSDSPKERYLMTPLALVAAICFWLTMINMEA